MFTSCVPTAGTMPTLRRYLSLTQTHLATLLGTTRWAVAQAEAGTRYLTGEARDALSALLKALPLATRQALAVVPGYDPPPLPPSVPDPPAPLSRPLVYRRHQATLELDRVLEALAPIEARRLASAARLALLAYPACPPWPTMRSLLPRLACGLAPKPRPTAACCWPAPPACGPSWKP